MKRSKPFDPHGALKEASSDLFTIGIVFVALGGLFGLIVVADVSGNRSFELQALGGSCATLMIAPGCWYVIAAAQLRRKQFGLVRSSMMVAIGQVALVLMALAVGALFRSSLRVLLPPAVISVFFVPAVIATLVHIRRVEQALHLLSVDGHAFEAVMKVEAIETNDRPNQSDNSGHP